MRAQIHGPIPKGEKRMLHRKTLFVLGLLGLIAPSLRADILAPGTYHLNNHPDGGRRPPNYGLRLDELYNVTNGHDVWTFDFEHAGSAMYLDYLIVDDNKVLHIYGTSYGGLDGGTDYHADHQGFFDIDFTYEVGVETVPGDDDIWVIGNEESLNYNNWGTIKPSGGDEDAPETDDTRYLYDFAGEHDFTFRLGDQTNDVGHRGFDGVSGWGWLNYQPGLPHVYASDWLFTVGSPVPAPGAFMLGALGLVMVRRFRKQA